MESMNSHDNVKRTGNNAGNSSLIGGDCNEFTDLSICVLNVGGLRSKLKFPHLEDLINRQE